MESNNREKEQGEELYSPRMRGREREREMIRGRIVHQFQFENIF